MADSDAWIKVAESGDLADDSVLKVETGGRTIALVRTGGKVGALDNRCPHAGGPLAEGSVEFGLLVCPWHGRDFDPFTGECPSYAEAATALPVSERDGAIYVRA